MSARQPGQQLDILPLILSIEEQANENAQRVDNVMRNLVDLAGAVRTLVQKVEEQRKFIEERFSEQSELYDMVPPAFSEDLPSTQFAILQAADSQIAQRLAFLEQRLHELPSPGETQPVDVKPLEGRLNKLESTLANALTSLESRSSTGGPGKPADLSPVFRQVDSLREELDAQAGGLAARLSALEKSVQAGIASGDAPNIDLGPLEERLQRTESAVEELLAAATQPDSGSSAIEEVRSELEALRGAEIQLPADIVRSPDLEGSIARIEESLGNLRDAQGATEARLAGELDSRLSAVTEQLQASLREQLAALESQRTDAAAGVSSGEIEALSAQMASDREALLQLVQDAEAALTQAVSDQASEIADIKNIAAQLAESTAQLQSEQGALRESGTSKEALQRLEKALTQLQPELAQLKSQQAVFAEQKQLAKLMEHLSDLQARSARLTDQIKELDQQLQRGGQEHQLQLQNQLDMQERQRVLIEQLQTGIASLSEQVTAQHAMVEQQQTDVARLLEQAEQAARDRQLRRRASDAPIADSSVQPLIESALHIERGEYAEAVRCLEAAQQLSDSPKLGQALELARKLLEQQPAGEPAQSQA